MKFFADVGSVARHIRRRDGFGAADALTIRGLRTGILTDRATERAFRKILNEAVVC